MKQNSSILFHHMHKSLRGKYFCYLLLSIWAVICGFSVTDGSASDKLEYLTSFDPAKGFKPAQSDLTEIFLQIAGSLECYGSPEPYLRHMKAEHERIEAKYHAQLGTASKSFCPAYMTDDYFVNFASTWAKLSPKLDLESLTTRTGHTMRDAILGTRGTGTMLVDIFNRHQSQVYAAMTGKSKDTIGFDSLESELVKRLHFNEATIHDSSFTMAERDAVDFSLGAREEFVRLFAALDAKLTPAAAEQVKALILSMVIDVGRMAESELEIGLSERALDRQTAQK